MPDYKLRIIVNGEDRASKTFKDIGGSLDDFGDKVKGIGSGLSVGLTAPLVALGAAAINAGTQLNAGLANIASLGIAESRVLELKSSVQDMAIEFGKSTNEMVDGAYQLISTFGDSADTTRLLEISTKAAAAGLATVTDAILLGGAVTKAYGDTSAEAYQHVQDLAFTAVNLGVTTFPELASAMGKVIPLTAALGVSVEDTFGVMATFTGVTGNTSEVVTQLRGVMQALMDPTAATTELFKAMGIESGKAAIEQLGLQGTMQLMVDAAAATGLPLSDFIGSIEGQTLAMQAAGGSQEQFTKNLIAMQNVSGALDTAFTAQTTGVNALGFQFQQAKAKLEVFLQTISDAMGPALLVFANAVTPLGDKIQALAVKFAAMDPATQTWIVGLAAGAAALGPVLIAVGAIIPVLGKMAAALGLLTSPLGLVAAGIAAAFYFDVGGIRGKFMGVLTSAQEMASGVLNALKPLMEGKITIGEIVDNGESIAKFLVDMGMAKKSANDLGKAIDGIGPAFGRVNAQLESAGSIVTPYFARLKAHLASLDESGKGAFTGWDAAINSFFSNAQTKILSLDQYGKGLGKSFNELMTWDFGAADATFNKWFSSLNAWEWPTLEPATWVTDLMAWVWPSVGEGPGWVVSLMAWVWPVLNPVGWVTTLLAWSWPTLTQPGWIAQLMNWAWPAAPAAPTAMPDTSGAWFGFPGNSTGTPSFGGGWTWVGERGPELLQLPRGTQVLSNQQSMGMIGQLAGGTGGLTAGQQAGFNAFVANQSKKEADKAAKEFGR